MSERTSYAPGTPCWVELSGTPDVEASGALLRRPVRLGGPGAAELGGNGRLPAGETGRRATSPGVSPQMEDGQPTVWATYVSVEDADGDGGGGRRDAGGSVIVEPMDVMELGQMAVFADPTGAVFGIWQPGTFAGAELVNESGCLRLERARHPRHRRRQGSSTARSSAGASRRKSPSGPAPTRSGKSGEAMVGGMLDMSAVELPAEVPPHWLVYFTVEDTDAAVEKVKGGGGDVRWSARSTSRSAASPSSRIRSARSSR